MISYSNLLFEFAEDWLIRNGYAFFDEAQGILPIKWKDIPRSEWGEVPEYWSVGP